jgi:hypothetical protein
LTRRCEYPSSPHPRIEWGRSFRRFGVNVECLILVNYHEAPKQCIQPGVQWIILTYNSKRFEKQIKDIQDKAETVKMEVCCFLPAHAHRMLKHCPDHSETNEIPLSLAADRDIERAFMLR